MTRTPRTVAGRVTAVVIAVVATAASGGCTSVNQPLNDQRLPIERRALNFTRAGTGVESTPIASQQTARVRPADVPRRAPVVADVYPDGCFIGLALSGGGPSPPPTTACSATGPTAGIYEAAELLFRERFEPELVELREELDAPGGSE